MKNILIALLFFSFSAHASYIDGGTGGGGGAVDSVNGQTGVVALDTDDVPEGTAQYFTAGRAIASALSGYTSGAGTVAASDTILQAIQKLNGNDALRLALAGGTLSGQLNTTYVAGTAIRCTRSDTARCLGTPDDSSQGIRFLTDGSIDTYYSSASRLIMAGQGASVVGRIKQYDIQVTGDMPATGFNRFASTTSVGNAAATPTDVLSKTLEAGNWTRAKSGYTYKASGFIANTASTDKYVKLTLGSTVIYDSGALTAATAAGSWSIIADCDYRDSTHAVCTTEFKTSFAAYMSNTAVVIANETLANALAFKATIFGTNASDVTYENGKILYNNESWN